MDFGSTAVTGMHCGCVAALRAYYGLEKRPVKVCEPYQMLGLIEDDLLDAIGVDTVGVFPRNSIVVFLCGTDFGTQSGTFCSPESYQALWHPYYKKVNDWIHENTTWKTFKHSCGAVEGFMELFIKSGFDIINPVQCSAKGMEAEMLKKKYGSRLVFWGGGVDTQHILPFGTPEQVREQVLQRCAIFAKDGGFVFDAVHNVQAKTPVENIAA